MVIIWLNLFTNEIKNFKAMSTELILHLPDLDGILSQIFSNFKEVETWDVLWSVQYCHASIIIDQN
jgi:hypothetical protein